MFCAPMIKQTLKCSHNLRRNVENGVQPTVKTVSKYTRFICPECGSEDFVGTDSGQPLVEIYRVRRTVVCAVCHFEVPLHLAQRWGRLSLAEAKKQWCELYRPECVLHSELAGRQGEEDTRFGTRYRAARPMVRSEGRAAQTKEPANRRTG